jgi:peptidoglycan/xylan/chitin deacetylase (PgdA/CDA1 family)
MRKHTHVLLFHRVHPIRDEMWDPMDPRLFEMVLQHITKTYNVVAAKEHLCSQAPDFARSPLIITFDDGYKDFVQYALPLLRKYSCPATMFIVTDCVESGSPPWTYLVDHYCSRTRRSSLHLPAFDGAGGPMEHRWTSEQERLVFAKRLKQSLKRVPSKDREEITASVLEQLNDVDPPSGLMMSWSEVAEVKSAGIEIGAHTKSHPALAFVADEQELWDEIFGAGELIRTKTGTFPSSISYPVGSYDRRVKQFAERAGYKFGYAVDQHVFNPRRHDSFAIPRLELYNEPYWKTRLRVDGVVARVKSLLRK